MFRYAAELNSTKVMIDIIEFYCFVCDSLESNRLRDGHFCLIDDSQLTFFIGDVKAIRVRNRPNKFNWVRNQLILLIDQS